MRPEGFGIDPEGSGIRPEAFGIGPEAFGILPTSLGIGPEGFGANPETLIRKDFSLECSIQRHRYTGTFRNKSTNTANANQTAALPSVVYGNPCSAFSISRSDVIVMVAHCCIVIPIVVNIRGIE